MKRTITIDLNKNLSVLALEPSQDGGEPTPTVKEAGEKMSRWMAQLLWGSQSGDAIKYVNWAFDCWRNGSLEVDESDHEHLCRLLEADKQLPRGILGQLLRELRNAKTPVG